MNKKLLKGTFIYAIGNCGTKILSIIIVPFYTYVISTSDYGIYDYLETIISLLLPFVSLNINDAVMTWMLNKKQNKNNVIKVAFETWLFTSVVIAFVGIYIYLQIKSSFVLFIVSIAILRSAYNVLQQILRGLRKQYFYAISGIIYSICLLGSNCILVLICKIGIQGMFISEIFAPVVVTAVILIFNREILYALCGKTDIKLFSAMIKFSLPLIPNAVSWWIMNASDRFFIKYYISDSANGIYAVANKFSSMIVLITSFFSLSWQEVGIESFYEENGKEIFEKTFKRYATLLFSVVLMFLPATKWIILIFKVDYRLAVNYAGILCIGAVFSALAAFYNVLYMVSKKTMVILMTSVVAACINIIINYVGILTGGLYIAGISTLISYLVLFYLRSYISYKNYGIKIQLGKLNTWILLECIYALLVIVISNFTIMLCMELIAVLLFVILNREILCEVRHILLKKLRCEVRNER